MRGSIISVVEGSEGNYNQNRSWQEIRDCRPDSRSRYIYIYVESTDQPCIPKKIDEAFIDHTSNSLEMRCHDSELCFISPHDGIPLRFRLIF